MNFIPKYGFFSSNFDFMAPSETSGRMDFNTNGCPFVGCAVVDVSLGRWETRSKGDDPSNSHQKNVTNKMSKTSQ